MRPEWIVSFDALMKVYNDDAYSNIAANQAIASRPNCNAAFVRSMVRGVVRDCMKIDSYIDRLSSRGIGSLKIRPLIVLRMGIYAVCSMDSVPDYAAVNEAASLARSVCRGNSPLVNAVMRSFVREREKLTSYRPDGGLSRISHEYSFPKPLVELLLKQYGDDDGLGIIRALGNPPRLAVRVNTLRTSREELIRELSEAGCTAEPSGISQRGIIVKGHVIGTEAFRRGALSVQTEASMKAAECLSPEAGSDVLDMCAAPGGKSAAMAEIMCNRGRIVSCDVHEHRLELIRRTAERLGIDIIETRAADGTVYDESMEEAFDFVLADAPCSGIGVIGSKPELKYRFSQIDMEELQKKQRSILENAVRYVRPGGYVMYSTCTLNRDENEHVAERFAEECGFINIVETNLILPYNNTAGFYYCKLQKAR